MTKGSINLIQRAGGAAACLGWLCVGQAQAAVYGLLRESHGCGTHGECYNKLQIH